MMKIKKNALLIAALIVGTIGFTNCGGSGSTNTTNTVANNAANNSNKTVATTNASTPANTTPANAEAPKNTETAKTETKGDSVGVPECDEYIEKYEACLTKIAEKAPQVQTGLKTAFEQQRNAFKQAASNPASKATLPSTCKQAIETSKQATAAYACTW